MTHGLINPIAAVSIRLHHKGNGSLAAVSTRLHHKGNDSLAALSTRLYHKGNETKRGHERKDKFNPLMTEFYPMVHIFMFSTRGTFVGAHLPQRLLRRGQT